MEFDDDRTRSVNADFVSTNEMHECDTSWEETVFNSYKDYIK